MNQYILILILLYLAKREGCLNTAAFWCLVGLVALDSGCLGALLSAANNGCNNGCNSCCS